MVGGWKYRGRNVFYKGAECLRNGFSQVVAQFISLKYPTLVSKAARKGVPLVCVRIPFEHPKGAAPRPGQVDIKKEVPLP